MATDDHHANGEIVDRPARHRQRRMLGDVERGSVGVVAEGSGEHLRRARALVERLCHRERRGGGHDQHVDVGEDRVVRSPKTQRQVLRACVEPALVRVRHVVSGEEEELAGVGKAIHRPREHVPQHVEHLRRVVAAPAVAQSAGEHLCPDPLCIDGRDDVPGVEVQGHGDPRDGRTPLSEHVDRGVDHRLGVGRVVTGKTEAFGEHADAKTLHTVVGASRARRW